MKCMQTNFGGHVLLGFRDFGDYSSFVNIELKKFMQVEVDKLCMCTDFGGRGFSGFEDTITLKNGQIFLSDHGL